MLFFGLGICLHYLNFPNASQFSFKSNENIVFKISKKLNSTDKNKKYEAIVQIGKETFNSIVLIPKNSKEFDFEHYYKAKAYVSQPQSPQYDFQFDYAKYLHRKKIFYQCFINDEVSSATRNDLSFAEKIRQKRLNVLNEINHSEMSPKSQEFLKGIILADRTEIDSETLQDFNRSGLVHFLAISGTHVVVIFGMLYFNENLAAKISEICYHFKFSFHLVFCFIYRFRELSCSFMHYADSLFCLRSASEKD